MGIRAINNRIHAIGDTLNTIEQEAAKGNYSTAADLTDRLDRQSLELWKELWKTAKEVE